MTRRVPLILSAACCLLALAACENPQGSSDPKDDTPSDPQTSSVVSVTYIRNNADSGDVPVDATEYAPGATVTVAGNTGNLARTYYTYANWNTKADGTGVSYKAGDTIAIGSEDLTLYAAWFTEPAGFVYDDSSGTSVTITGYNYDDKITEVIIPPTIGGLPVTAIGRAFEVKTKMVSVLIPQSVTSIGNLAFAYCTALASVAIPSSVTYIGSSAFDTCQSLSSVIIPASVTSIGDNAFHSCQRLSSVLIEEGVSSIGNGMFFLCTDLVSVVIPPSVTSIGDAAFYDCSKLTTVVIPASVTSIGTEAFSGCTNLPSVVIPASVTSIGYQAFDYCGSLTSVHIKRYVPGGSPEITQLATYKAFFHGPSAGRTIYVPTAAVAAYKADAEWGYLETAEPGTIQGE